MTTSPWGPAGWPGLSKMLKPEGMGSFIQVGMRWQSGAPLARSPAGDGRSGRMLADPSFWSVMRKFNEQ
jgi:hypothetical protein